MKKHNWLQSSLSLGLHGRAARLAAQRSAQENCTGGCTTGYTASCTAELDTDNNTNTHLEVPYEGLFRHGKSKSPKMECTK
jgi:hypothetical protein